MGETATPIRRSFVHVREIAGLVVGALLGRPPVLRRILGARRAGRYGAGLLLAAALLAAPPRQLPWLAGIWIALAAGAWRLQPHPPAPRPLRLRELLRVSLWTGAPLVAGAAPLRAIGASEVAVPIALAISSVLLHRHLSHMPGPEGSKRA